MSKQGLWPSLIHVGYTQPDNKPCRYCGPSAFSQKDSSKCDTHGYKFTTNVWEKNMFIGIGSVVAYLGRCRPGTICTGSTSFHLYTRSSVAQPSGEAH